MVKFFQSRRFALVVGALLIIIGLPFMVRSARSAMGSYRAMQFAAEHNFDAGNPDIELVSPWMNIRYIAEAYTVPQSFLFDEMGIKMTRSASELPLGRLNQRFKFGDSKNGGPALVDIVRNAIVAYHENPVVTGLSEKRVQKWMNIQYIANSTGIATELFFDELGIPQEGHLYMPLPRLVDQAGYEPGTDNMIKTLERVIDMRGGKR